MPLTANDFLTLRTCVIRDFGWIAEDLTQNDVMELIFVITNGWSQKFENNDNLGILKNYYVDTSDTYFKNQYHVQSSDQPVISYLARLYLFKGLYEFLEGDKGKKFTDSLLANWKHTCWTALNCIWKEALSTSNPSGSWINMSPEEIKNKLEHAEKILTTINHWGRRFDAAIKPIIIIFALGCALYLLSFQLYMSIDENISADHKKLMSVDNNPFRIGIEFLVYLYMVYKLYSDYRNVPAANLIDMNKFAWLKLKLIGIGEGYIQIPSPDAAPFMGDIFKEIKQSEGVKQFLNSFGKHLIQIEGDNKLELSKNADTMEGSFQEEKKYGHNVHSL